MQTVRCVSRICTYKIPVLATRFSCAVQVSEGGGQCPGVLRGDGGGGETLGRMRARAPGVLLLVGRTTGFSLRRLRESGSWKLFIHRALRQPNLLYGTRLLSNGANSSPRYAIGRVGLGHCKSSRCFVWAEDSQQTLGE